MILFEKVPESIIHHLFTWLTEVDIEALDAAFCHRYKQQIHDTYHSIHNHTYIRRHPLIGYEYLRERICKVCRKPYIQRLISHYRCRKGIVHRTISDEIMFMRKWYTLKRIQSQLNIIKKPSGFVKFIRIHIQGDIMPSFFRAQVESGNFTQALDTINNLCQLGENRIEFTNALVHERLHKLLPPFHARRWSAQSFIKRQFLKTRELHELILTHQDDTTFMNTIHTRLDFTILSYNALRLASWLEESCMRTIEIYSDISLKTCIRTKCPGCDECTHMVNMNGLANRLRSTIRHTAHDLAMVNPFSYTYDLCMYIRMRITYLVLSIVRSFAPVQRYDFVNIYLIRRITQHYIIDIMKENKSIPLHELMEKIQPIGEFLQLNQQVVIFDMLSTGGI